MNTTLKTTEIHEATPQAKEKEMEENNLYLVATEVEQARDRLNRRHAVSNYGAINSFHAEGTVSSSLAIETLEALIAVRKDQIANAEYRLREYQAALAAQTA